jgi:hypothetical protein
MTEVGNSTSLSHSGSVSGDREENVIEGLMKRDLTFLCNVLIQLTADKALVCTK